MDIGSILLLLGILLLVGLYISLPLTKKIAAPVSVEGQEYSSLLADRDQILNSLRELDFDFDLGKIPEEHYPSERAALLQRGATILQKLDKYQGEKITDEDNTKLANEISSGTGGTSVSQAYSIEDDELEAMIANRIRVRKGKSNGFCPQCGHAVQQSDQFCPKCGHSIRKDQ